jgi:uncharacterized protein (DUF1778 family)
LIVLQYAVQYRQGGFAMAQSRSTAAASSLVVRLDEDSKDVLARAAAARGISISDYVRQVTVTQARKEVAALTSQTIAMTADEQFAFWTALNAPVTLTSAQKKLGKLMRGA